MKKYLLTIILVVLVIAGLILILIEKKGNRVKVPADLPSIQLDNSKNNQRATSDGDKVSVEEGLKLEIVSPKDKETVNSSPVTITGKTNPNAEVFVNEKELKADLNGNFSVSYELYEGENDIFVAVNDELGNFAEKSITVYLETAE